MQNRLFLSLAAAALLALPSIASANTVVITGDLNAPTGNFGTGGDTATYGYTITTSDNGTSVIVAVTTSTSTPNNVNFANLYFDTNAFAPSQLGSTVGFEASDTAVNDAFIPGVPGSNVAVGAGFSSVLTTGGGDKTITVTIPNSFFLTDPLGMGFPTTPDGGYVSLHISQSFGDSAVGQHFDFPTPVELGLVKVSSANVVPEPAGLTYMALSGFGLLAEAGRRLRRRKNA